MAAEISSRLWLIRVMARLIRTKARTNTMRPIKAALYIATPNSNTQGAVLVTLNSVSSALSTDYCTATSRRKVLGNHKLTLPTGSFPRTVRIWVSALSITGSPVSLGAVC